MASATSVNEPVMRACEAMMAAMVAMQMPMQQEPRRHQLIERVAAAQLLALVLEQPRALAQIVEQQRRFDKSPADADVALAAVAQVGIQGLGPRGAKKYRAQQPEPAGVIAPVNRRRSTGLKALRMTGFWISTAPPARPAW